MRRSEGVYATSPFTTAFIAYLARNRPCREDGFRALIGSTVLPADVSIDNHAAQARHVEQPAVANIADAKAVGRSWSRRCTDHRVPAKVRCSVN